MVQSLLEECSGAQQRSVSVFKYLRRDETISVRVLGSMGTEGPEGSDSSRMMSWAREARDVRGRVCDWRVCLAEVMRSHSSAMAVARCGFEAGMGRGRLVLGLRTGRLSRWIVCIPSVLNCRGSGSVMTI